MISLTERSEQIGRKIFIWCVRHWRDIITILSVVFGAGGIYFGIRAIYPRQRLSYGVRPSFEVFNAEENRRLGVIVDCGEANSPGQGRATTGKIVEEPNIIVLDGRRWKAIKDNIDAFDIDIQNSGTKPLWYNEDRPEDACAVCIEMEPAVEVFDAYVVEGDTNDNKFEVVENNEWSSGHVACKWWCLPSKESVVVRVVHTRPEEKIKVSLSGELRENLKPKQVKLPRIPTLGQRASRRNMFWLVFVTTALLWTLSGLHALRRWRRDRKLLEEFAIPEGVAPSLLMYWRHEAVLRLWLLLCIIVFVIGLVIF